MAVKANDSCIACGACTGVCPVGALSVDTGKMTCDASVCIGCGACKDTCPVGAIEDAD